MHDASSRAVSQETTSDAMWMRICGRTEHREWMARKMRMVTRRERGVTVTKQNVFICDCIYSVDLLIFFFFVGFCILCTQYIFLFYGSLPTVMCTIYVS